MRHGHGGRHSVSSFCFAALAQADEHPRVNRRLVGVVVVGQQRLPELTLAAVVRLEERRGWVGGRNGYY